MTGVQTCALPIYLDVLFYSDLGPRRLPLFNALVQRKLSVSATFGLLPEYVKFELIGRARLIADARRNEDVRFMAPTRLVIALHAGVGVVSEAFDTGPLSTLYRYVVTTDAGGFLDTCANVARNPDILRLGAMAREAFARDTSMARNLRAAMQGPLFSELAV